jgi:transglutaminase-like putative cysteine protease/predicted glutamine amidotransferase
MMTGPMPTPPSPEAPAPNPALKRQEHQLTKLLALSLDGAASPSIRLAHGVPGHKHDDAPYGWGFAWYPAQTSCAMVIKDPTSIGENAMTKLLSDWERFESTVFVCHLRGAARTLIEQDTQPFSKTFGGRDFVLAHNGDLFVDLATALPLGDDPAFTPIGGTDSEHAFSWLLQKLRDRRARRLADIGWPLLHQWLCELDELGTANFLITDGIDLCAYRDAEGYNGLGWSRLVPPYAHTAIETEDFTLDLDDVAHRGRSLVMVSTHPVGDVPFEELQPGQLLVFRRGAVTFDSRGGAAPSQSLRGDASGANRAETQLQAAAHGGITPLGAATAGMVVDPASPSASMPDAPTLDTVGPSAPTRDTAGPSAPMAAAPMQTAAAPSSATDAAPLPQGEPAPPQAPADPSRPARAERLVRPEITTTPLDWRVLSIVHDTTYRYAQAVNHSVHAYRLRPCHDLGQQVLAHQLDISVNGERRDYEDVFGNAVTRVELTRDYHELRITSRSIVAVAPPRTPNLMAVARRSTFPLVWMPWQRQMMTPYLLPPELPETQLTELSEFAMLFAARQDNDLVRTAMDINLTIQRDFSYVSGSTTLETTPFDVYINRRGVCQDFANLLICLARLLGIPARYRVGYIFTGAGYENKVQSDASHAWAELYLPHYGWQGFDPTNGCLVGLDHVRVACGRNYRDATPTAGTIYKGGGAEQLFVDVRVEEA